jgi:hypothetical protein
MGEIMRSGLKLFVWEGFDPDYTDGLAFAIAKDEAEAKKLVIEDIGYDPSGWRWGRWGTLTVYPINKKIAKAVHGGG